MFKFAAAASFAIAIIFEVWGAADGMWNWVLMMLIGWLCMAASQIWDK